MLRRSEIRGLRFGAVENGRQRLRQLFLQMREPERRTVCSRFVPETDESIIERPVEVHQMEESSNRS